MCGVRLLQPIHPTLSGAPGARNSRRQAGRQCPVSIHAQSANSGCTAEQLNWALPHQHRPADRRCWCAPHSQSPHARKLIGAVSRAPVHCNCEGKQCAAFSTARHRSGWWATCCCCRCMRATRLPAQQHRRQSLPSSGQRVGASSRAGSSQQRAWQPPPAAAAGAAVRGAGAARLASLVSANELPQAVALLEGWLEQQQRPHGVAAGGLLEGEAGAVHAPGSSGSSGGLQTMMHACTRQTR